ncbi:MAG: hypothetical protein E6G85_13925 [Alphaproteobacteria bacterium]|nr:MAG: hypothetical protein E6G85_13925 [Alphaproteobacteria bacterium]
MNYAGKFDATISADGSGAHHSPAYIHLDSPHAQIPADAIVVPDAQLLFNADFKRSGVDLILSKDDSELVLHDYFKGEKRAPLASPDGAHLTGDLVNALTGHVQYSQAGGATAAGQVIGHVTKLAGTATAVRNGVSIILHQGDNVEKGDVVQSGSDSTLGVTFIDGTVFGLSSNARMVLNEMVYDPNGSSNSSLISLVAGTISFVAGETAKHGDMKIDTPVATMGIRGTAVLVEIDFTVPQGSNLPDAKFQVLVEPDGTTGSYILFDKTTLQPIAVVNQAGQQININNGVVSTSNSQLSPDLQKLITDVFQQKFASNDSDTKSQTHFTDSINPNLITGQLIKTASGTTATPIFQVTDSKGNSSSGSTGGTNGLQHVDQAPIAAAFGDLVTEITKITGSSTLDLAFNKINFNDINVGDRPTVSTSFASFTYTDPNGNDVKATLNALQLADVKATEVDLVVVQGPNNTNIGSASWTYLVPDHAFDFLAAGETLTLTYTALVDSNYAPLDLKTAVNFTITVTGTNDVPVITTDKLTQSIAFSGGTSVSGGPLISGDETKGTFAFTDPDLTDTHTVTAVLSSWTMSDGSAVPPGPLDAFKAALTAWIVEPTNDSTGTGTGTINWQLADLPAYLADFIPLDAELTLTYTVTLTDSQGATDTKTVQVTITGTDHAAEVWIHTTGDHSPNGLWSTAQNWETRLVPTSKDDVIIITDQLHGLTPSYPATIDGSTAAVAKSVTMNDFNVPNPPDPLHQSPELDVQSGGTLTIGSGGLSLSADSILNNAGTISVAGKAEFVDQSVLKNSGSMTLALGGDFKDQSAISNTAGGEIEVSGGTLNVLVNVDNSGGTVQVDDGAALILNGAGISGGTVTIKGTLDLEGTSFLKDGTLVNTGTIDVGGAVTFDNETVHNSDIIEIFAGGSLTLDPTNVDNAGGTMTVDAAATLILDGTTITGGTITDNGTIHVTADSAIDGAVMTAGQVTVDATLTLDGTTITGGTVTDNGTVHVDAGKTLKLSGVALTGGAITNLGTIEITGSGSINNDSFANAQLTVDANQILTLDGTTITGGSITDNGTVAVGSGKTLKLSGVALSGGAISNLGTIEITGSGSINDDSFANAQITVDSGQILTLDGTTITGGSVTDTGTVAVSSGKTLKLSGVALSGGAISNLGTIEITGSGSINNDSFANAQLTVDSGQILTLDGTTITGGSITDTGTVHVDAGNTLKLSGVALTGGAITNAGTIEITGSGSINDDIFANTQLTVDSGQILTLDGTTITGGSVTDTGTVAVSSGKTLKLSGVALSGGAISNLGTIEITGSGSINNDSFANTQLTIDGNQILMLDGTTITGGTVTDTGTVHVDAGNTLNLSGVALSGGAISNAGTIEITGDSSISSDALSNNQLTIDASTTLTLNGTTVTGGTVTDTAMRWMARPSPIPAALSRFWLAAHCSLTPPRSTTPAAASRSIALAR